MNILFFLTPKSEVCYVYDSDTMAQAIDKVLTHGYTTVPVVDESSGRYEGTLAADDLLRALTRRPRQSVEEAPGSLVRSFDRRRDYRPVRADAEIEDLLHYAESQNFVPVVDDTGAFIGIVTRRDVIRYLEKRS